MKEASGELNMTLITIVAVAIIGAIFLALYPSIRTRIENTWNESGSDLENAFNNRQQSGSGSGTVGGN